MGVLGVSVFRGLFHSSVCFLSIFIRSFSLTLSVLRLLSLPRSLSLRLAFSLPLFRAFPLFSRSFILKISIPPSYPAFVPPFFSPFFLLALSPPPLLHPFSLSIFHASFPQYLPLSLPPIFLVFLPPSLRLSMCSLPPLTEMSVDRPTAARVKSLPASPMTPRPLLSFPPLPHPFLTPLHLSLFLLILLVFLPPFPHPLLLVPVRLTIILLIFPSIMVHVFWTVC